MTALQFNTYILLKLALFKVIDTLRNLQCATISTEFYSTYQA